MSQPVNRDLAALPPDGGGAVAVPPDDAAWAALVARRPWQGVYAVVSTGIACRFGCLSRRPLRANVRLFATLGDAARAGFRPCRRCLRDARSENSR